MEERQTQRMISLKLSRFKNRQPSAFLFKSMRLRLMEMSSRLSIERARGAFTKSGRGSELCEKGGEWGAKLKFNGIQEATR